MKKILRSVRARKLVAIGMVTAFGGLSAPINAETEFNRKIVVVGSQAGGTSYIKLDAVPSAGCLYDTIYIDVTTDPGKAAYATALSARMASVIVPRVMYSKSAGTCYLTLIEI